MPIANLGSVLTHGILSYERAAKLEHHSVALQPVQEKRDRKQVPGGLRLHQYANLYFHARNPMLYKRQAEAPGLCVLRVSTQVLALEGTVISDQNAASDYVRFLHPRQWKLFDFDAIYALDWRHPGDPVAYFRHARGSAPRSWCPTVSTRGSLRAPTSSMMQQKAGSKPSDWHCRSLSTPCYSSVRGCK